MIYFTAALEGPYMSEMEEFFFFTGFKFNQKVKVKQAWWKETFSLFSAFITKQHLHVFSLLFEIDFKFIATSWQNMCNIYVEMVFLDLIQKGLFTPTNSINPFLSAYQCFNFRFLMKKYSLINLLLLQQISVSYSSCTVESKISIKWPTGLNPSLALKRPVCRSSTTSTASGSARGSSRTLPFLLPLYSSLPITSGRENAGPLTHAPAGWGIVPFLGPLRF